MIPRIIQAADNFGISIRLPIYFFLAAHWGRRGRHVRVSRMGQLRIMARNQGGCRPKRTNL